MALYTMVACSRNALSAVWRVRREMKRREKRSKPIYRALGALAVQKRSTVIRALQFALHCFSFGGCSIIVRNESFCKPFDAKQELP